MKKSSQLNENNELSGFLKRKSVVSHKEILDIPLISPSWKKNKIPSTPVLSLNPKIDPIGNAKYGILYIVSTPIGNLEDITLRALRILKEADIVACEDTRTTGHLLTYFEITAKSLTSYHSHSDPRKAESIVSKLKEWKHVAVVSDAGTPGISDPAYWLVQLAIAANIVICPIPGPSALLSFLVVSWLPTHHFTYLGFLPVKKGRKTLLEELNTREETVVIYESVHRIRRTLQDLEKVLGSSRYIVIGRELTKKFETIQRGALWEFTSLQIHLEEKGEFVIGIGPKNHSLLARKEDLG